MYAELEKEFFLQHQCSLLHNLITMSSFKHSQKGVKEHFKCFSSILNLSPKHWVMLWAFVEFPNATIPRRDRISPLPHLSTIAINRSISFIHKNVKHQGLREKNCQGVRKLVITIVLHVGNWVKTRKKVFTGIDLKPLIEMSSCTKFQGYEYMRKTLGLK